jgi:hypothetical protein
MYNSVTQEAAGLAKTAAAYVTLRDTERARPLAVTLHRLYPHLDIYVRVRTLGIRTSWSLRTASRRVRIISRVRWFVEACF